MTVLSERATTGLEGLLAWLDDSALHYEVIDGAVVVSPPASMLHNDVTGDIYAQLRVACPSHLVVALDYGWRYDSAEPGSFLVPDLAVVRREAVDITASLHDAVPLLAVEIRSPSTWRLDEGDKKRIYAEGGIPSYWLVDPVASRLRVLELRDGSYEEVAVLSAGSELALERPFPVTLGL